MWTECAGRERMLNKETMQSVNDPLTPDICFVTPFLQGIAAFIIEDRYIISLR